MGDYLSFIPSNTYENFFFRAVYSVHNANYSQACQVIDSVPFQNIWKTKQTRMHKIKGKNIINYHLIDVINHWSHQLNIVIFIVITYLFRYYIWCLIYIKVKFASNIFLNCLKIYFLFVLKIFLSLFVNSSLTKPEIFLILNWLPWQEKVMQELMV